MKKQLLIIITLLFLSSIVNAQVQQSKKSKPATAIKPSAFKDTSNKVGVDTVYVVRGDKEVDLIFSIFERGLAASLKSDDFSINDRKRMINDIIHMRSIFDPQIEKYHPRPKTKEVKPKQ